LDQKDERVDEHSEWLRIGSGFRCTTLGCPGRPAVLVRREYVAEYHKGASAHDENNDSFVCEGHSGLSKAEIANIPFAGSPFTGDEDGSIRAHYDNLLKQAGLVDDARSRARTPTVLLALALLALLALVALAVHANGM
jgi:hypothetical protein